MTSSSQTIAPEAPPHQLDIQAVIDRQRSIRPHLPLLVLMTFIMLIDGYDIFMLGKIAPAMAKDFGEPVTALTIVFVVQQIGLAAGSFLVGPLSDRYGRKKVLLICVVIFGLLTLGPIWASSLVEVAILRGIAGLFLAGVIPNAAAMLTEFAPPHRRASFVSIAFTGYTAGGASGALVAMWLLDDYGWEIGFWIGGLAPLIIAPFFALLTNESLQFRARRNPSDPQIAKALKRLEPDLNLEGISHFRIGGEDARGEGKKSEGGVLAIFQNGRAPTTTLLWVAYFLALGLISLLGAWMATLFLELGGIPLSVWAGYSLLSFVGGVAGTSSVGFLMDRFGRAPILIGLFLTDAVALAMLGMVPFGSGAFIVMIVLWGYCQAGGQAGLNAICAQVYPTQIRASGVGWAFGMGRVGGIAMPAVGGLMLAGEISMTQVFLILAVFPVLVAIALVGIGWLDARGRLGK
ncbi:MAG: MFS transporter [Sphingobium sp.]|nr:MFS transporter [Sphingobium sp.]